MDKTIWAIREYVLAADMISPLQIHALNEEKEDLMNQILTLQSQVAEVPSLRAEIEELKEKLKSAGHS